MNCSKAGQITPEGGRTSPTTKHYHAQSIGQRGEVQPDVGMISLEDDDYIVLNSDGLSNMISESEIYDIMTSDITLSEKAETLIRFANNRWFGQYYSCPGSLS